MLAAEPAPEQGRKEETGEQASTREPAAHTYDRGYKKWESFDVVRVRCVERAHGMTLTRPCAQEAALAAEDSSGDEGAAGAAALAEGRAGGGGKAKAATAASSASTAVVTPASMLPPPSAVTRRAMRAPVAGWDARKTPLDRRPREEVEKDAGNEHFRAGRFAEAAAAYTRAIGLNPAQPTYHSNRAMAHLKMKEWGRAREDAQAALALDPSNAKVGRGVGVGWGFG